jgi:hypothetical protein
MPINFTGMLLTYLHIVLVICVWFLSVRFLLFAVLLFLQVIRIRVSISVIPLFYVSADLMIPLDRSCRVVDGLLVFFCNLFGEANRYGNTRIDC